MTNVQDATQAQQLTNVLCQAEYTYKVGIITSGDFMTSDANGALLPTPYAAMQELLGATYGSSGGGATSPYTVTVDSTATSNPIMAGYTAGTPIGGASGQFVIPGPGSTTKETPGYYYSAYSTYTGYNGTLATNLADINVQGSSTPVQDAVIQTKTGGTNTIFGDTGMMGDSNLLQHVVQNAVFGTAPSLAMDTTRFNGIVASRTDLDQSQYPADISGIYNTLMPLLQQWKSQYDFVGSFYTLVGDNSGGDNPNSLAAMTPYLDQMLALGNEIGSHSVNHLISPRAVDANGNPVPTTVVNGQTVSTWNENTNYLYTTAPANGSAPNWTYAYEFGMSNTLIDRALGIKVAGAAVPGANDTSATSLSILPYYPSGSGLTGYVNGGWTGVGSGSPNAIGYISPANTSAAPNITFDFSEVQYQNKTTTQALADWEALFSQLSANSQSPIVVWPWHDYSLGTMALNVVNGGSNKIQNAGNWYAYNSNSVFMAKSGVSNVTVTRGATQDDVTHIASLPMRADLQSVTGDGTNLSYSAIGDGSAVIDLKTPGTNIVSLSQTVAKAGTPIATPSADWTATLAAAATGGALNQLTLNLTDPALTLSASSPTSIPLTHTVTVSEIAAVAGAAATVGTGNNIVFGGTGNDIINIAPNDFINDEGNTGGIGNEVVLMAWLPTTNIARAPLAA